MRCPFCSHTETQVKDSRPSEDHTTIRRRRVCTKCGGRFTTFERVQLRELIVVKTDGQKEAFDREKLLGSMRIALRKRPVDEDRIDQLVSAIVRQLESSGESEIPTKKIGEMAMNALRKVDHIGYIRYASVYKNFREVSDFNDLLDALQLPEDQR